MPIPKRPVSSHAPNSSWHKRVGRAPSKFLLLVKNARHIERLIRDPKTIGPESAASLVRTVNLVIERRCNIRCACCHYFKSYDAGANERTFELAEMLSLLDEVPQASVAITGGEPLMSPLRVVEAAQTLLKKGRDTVLVTNCLPLVEKNKGELVRAALLNGVRTADRPRLRIRCSVDLEHQEGGRLSVEDYVAKCHTAIRFLSSAGFAVFTRSIVTNRRDYEFFRDHVVPLSSSGVTRGASVQPDMYNLPAFAAAHAKGELGDVGRRLGKSYLTRILGDGAPGPKEKGAPPTSVLRSAPWALIEVNARGVKGPSGFLAATAQHDSVTAMLRSYDWLPIADSMVPQITISNNAFLYRVNKRTRAVSLNYHHLVNRLVQR